MAFGLVAAFLGFGVLGFFGDFDGFFSLDLVAVFLTTFFFLGVTDFLVAFFLGVAAFLVAFFLVGVAAAFFLGAFGFSGLTAAANLKDPFAPVPFVYTRVPSHSIFVSCVQKKCFTLSFQR